MMLRSFSFLLSILLTITVFAQDDMPDIRLTTLQNNQPLEEALLQLEQEYPIRFYFNSEWLSPFKVNASQNNLSLQELLQIIFQDTEYSFITLGPQQLVIIKDQEKALARAEILQRAVQEKKKIESVSIGSYANYVPGALVRLQGKVIDGKTGLYLGGSSIFVTPTQQSFSTQADGTYNLSLPAGEYVLTFRYVNYEEKLIDLKIYQDGKLDVELQETPFYLDELVISADPIIERTGGQVSLQIQSIKRTPTFLGEVDIVKQLQVLPGVSTVGEAATGFNVRGGGADQNLVLFDGIPVFNISHVLGFFTAFNPDAVNEVSFYRGHMPAEYGGRVASALNIAAREGNFERWTGRGGIGFISSSLTLDGPLKKDTTSLLISLRSSYSDWMLRAVESNFQNVRNSSAFFYDGAIKLSHKTKSGNKITLSAYRSHDQFSLANDTVMSWQNQTVSLRYDQQINDRLFGSYTLGFGQYAYQVEDVDEAKSFLLNYDITYPTLRADFVLDARLPISFGLHSTWYRFNPGELKPQSTASNIRATSMPIENAHETALYASTGLQIKPRLYLDIGLRYGLYQRVGPGTTYQYAENTAREPRNTIDSTVYENAAIMQTYHGPEPRVSFRYLLDEKSSLKLSYNRLQQFIHLVSNTAAITPVDIWQASNVYFEPQRADMLALGYYLDVNDRRYEFFAETYFRKTRNVLDFKDGANLILNRQLETDLLLGLSDAYGIETSITKIKGRLTGNLNYTFARSLRIVDGTFDSEKINDGEVYPANFDQPHIVNLNWRYGISRRHFFSGGFTFRSGRPMSLPVSGYEIDGILISNFSARNQYRIPDYHRLDLAFIIEGNHKIKKPWSGTWIVSCYNVYARKNAFSVFFQDDGTGYLRPYRLAIIGTAIPTVTYNFKF